jgi:hypothetical protein
MSGGLGSAGFEFDGLNLVVFGAVSIIDIL